MFIHCNVIALKTYKVYDKITETRSQYPSTLYRVHLIIFHRKIKDFYHFLVIIILSIYVISIKKFSAPAFSLKLSYGLLTIELIGT